MRKLIFVMVTLFAFACDAPNQSSERGAGSEIEDKAPVDPAESTEDETSTDADTTTSDDMNRQSQDTLQ